MDALFQATAAELAALLCRREVSALEVFEAAAERVHALDPQLNALPGFDPDPGRAQAAEADRRLRAGDTAPLLGVPFSVKHNLWVAGRRVTQGSTRFASFVAPQDAFAVAQLRRAGAVFLGMSNCSEFA